MSYGSPNQGNSTARRGGGGLLFLILIGVGAYLFISSFSSGNKTQPLESDSGRPAGGIVSPGGQDRGIVENDAQKMPTQGRDKVAAGWDTGEVDSNKKSQTQSKDGNKVQNGNWSGEEVETNKDNSRVDLNLSNNKSGDVSESGTAKEGWSGEEVESGTNNSKKEGWSSEEVDK